MLIPQCVWSHESSISSSYFPLELCRAISHESGLRKLHCSGLLRARCSLQAAARKCSVQVALRKCSEQVGLCKLLCASCSVQALCACAPCKLLCASALSKLLCASALRQLLRASALRMCSVQVGLCKLLCASALCSCSVQVALRKLLCASDSAQVALHKCCRSCGNVLCVLFVYLKVAIFQPELRGCAPRTTFVLKSCDFQAVCSAYYVCTQKLRFSSLSFGTTLRILRLYLKVAIFQPELQEHAPRTTFVLTSCDIQAGAAADRGGIEPATAGLRKQARKSRDKIQRPFREQENCMAPQRERFDAHDLRRGSHAACRNRKKSSVFEPRTRESPQRVARGLQKS